jgi:hypothetical protein
MTPLNIQLHAAERAHRELRAEAPGTDNPAAKAELLREILPPLEAAARALPELQETTERLRADAEFFAGLSDAEGYRDAHEAWLAYEDLRTADRLHSRA